MADRIPLIVDSSSSQIKELPDGDVITSPMVGTFYRAASPDSKPFVEKGQTYGNTTITTASDISSTATAGKLVKITNSDPKTDYQISTVASSNLSLIHI